MILNIIPSPLFLTMTRKENKRHGGKKVRKYNTLENKRHRETTKNVKRKQELWRGKFKAFSEFTIHGENTKDM